MKELKTVRRIDDNKRFDADVNNLFADGWDAYAITQNGGDEYTEFIAFMVRETAQAPEPQEIPDYVIFGLVKADIDPSLSVWRAIIKMMEKELFLAPQWLMNNTGRYTEALHAAGSVVSKDE